MPNRLRVDGRIAPKSQWQPEQGWLMLTPVTLPSKTLSGLELPESFTKKVTSGLCVRIFANTREEIDDYIDREVFFPAHAQHSVLDSETGEEFYFLPMNQAIATRTPPPKREVYEVPVLKGEGDGIEESRPRFEVATLQSSKG